MRSVRHPESSVRGGHGSEGVSIEALVNEKRAEILRIAAANGATRVRVFGSVARDTARPDSDLDLLIDLEPGRHLLDLVAIKQALEDLLGRNVHVVTEAAISPYIRRCCPRRDPPVSRDAISLSTPSKQRCHPERTRDFVVFPAERANDRDSSFVGMTRLSGRCTQAQPRCAPHRGDPRAGFVVMRRFLPPYGFPRRP